MCSTIYDDASLPTLLQTDKPLNVSMEETLEDFLDQILSSPRKVVLSITDKILTEFEKALNAYKKAQESCDESSKISAFKECLKKACHIKLAIVLFYSTPDNSPEERAAAGLEVSFW